MKQPQIELGRLLLGVGLLSAATACFYGDVTFGVGRGFAGLIGVYLLVAAIGVPFKRGFYLIRGMHLTALWLFAGVCVLGGILIVIVGAIRAAMIEFNY